MPTFLVRVTEVSKVTYSGQYEIVATDREEAQQVAEESYLKGEQFGELYATNSDLHDWEIEVEEVHP